MKGEVVTTVRLAIADIAAEAKTQNQIAAPLSDYRIDADHLVLHFAFSKAGDEDNAPSGPTALERRAHSAEDPKSRKGPNAGRRKKRHRMKTRGWKVMATITNSYGQRANVYGPFVEALSEKGLTAAQRRATVAKILRSNGNRPTDASVEYFLMNTVEYLRENNSIGQGKGADPS